MTSTLERARLAVQMAVSAFENPGPPVSTATPTLPVARE